jgi:hypothetical protein
VTYLGKAIQLELMRRELERRFNPLVAEELIQAQLKQFREARAK